MFLIEKVSGSPLASLDVGVKLYAVPTAIVVSGAPEIIGPPVPAAPTAIEKGASEALDEPSVTEMTMPTTVPMSLEVGVPLNAPVVVLKFAHDGFC
jgi:hypothetical protein